MGILLHYLVKEEEKEKRAEEKRAEEKEKLAEEKDKYYKLSNKSLPICIASFCNVV